MEIVENAKEGWGTRRKKRDGKERLMMKERKIKWKEEVRRDKGKIRDGVEKVKKEKRNRRDRVGRRKKEEIEWKRKNGNKKIRN